jgi:hypothetical protein
MTAANETTTSTIGLRSAMIDHLEKLMLGIDPDRREVARLVAKPTGRGRRIEADNCSGRARQNILYDAGLAYGARGGLAARAFAINEMLRSGLWSAFRRKPMRR